MKIFGLTIGREAKAGEVIEAKAATLATVEPAGLWTTIWHSGWETVTGGWQHNLRPRGDNKTILAFSGVYACLSLISGDVSKMCVDLTQRQADGTWQKVDAEDTHGNAKVLAFLAVLKKPNDYQTRVQFFMSWIIAKLIYGNAYVLKERDRSGAVVKMHVLWCNVTPLVNSVGEVFYQLQREDLAKIEDAVIVPASEIMHDRMVTFWHPLVGVSPIFACGQAALQGLSIQQNSEKFFSNMSVPSGVLLAPGKIADETAARVKDNWQKGFSGKGIGGIAVLGDGLEYKQMTIPASDAQLIEQLGWTIADVARCFHVPPYKLGLQTNVTFSNAGQLDQDYYSQCLQTLIEACEVLLDEGLELPPQYRTEFDLDGLIRMDPQAQTDSNAKAISAGYLKPNEARLKRNLSPVKGGDTPYMQNQNWPLEQLAERDVNAAPPAPPAPAMPTPDAGPPAPSKGEIAEAVMALMLPTLEQKAEAERKAEDQAAEFARRMIELAAAA